MNTYRYKIIQTVEVEAFDESDAWDAIQDEFGVGEQMGVKVLTCEFKGIRPTRNPPKKD